MLSEGTIERENVPVLAGLMDKKLKGIRSFHSFRLNGENLECYTLSEDINPTKTIELPSRVEILEEQIRIIEERIEALRNPGAVAHRERVQEEESQEEENDEIDAENGDNLSTEVTEDEETGTFAARRFDLGALSSEEGDVPNLEDQSPHLQKCWLMQIDAVRCSHAPEECHRAVMKSPHDCT